MIIFEPDMIVLHESFHALLMEKFDPENEISITVPRKPTRFSLGTRIINRHHWNFEVDKNIEYPTTDLSRGYDDVDNTQIRLIALPGYIESLVRNLLVAIFFFIVLANMFTRLGFSSSRLGIVYFTAFAVYIHVRWALNKESDLHYVLHPADCRRNFNISKSGQ